MKRAYPIEPVYQLASLLLAAILVHAVYVSVVRPRAEAELATQRAAMQADPEYVQERSMWVVIRDYEQEACFVLGLWAVAIMAFKAAGALRSQQLLALDLMPVEQGERILPEDARDHARSVEALPDADRATLLPRVLLAGLYRFAATRDIQAVSETTRGVCDAESERLDSEMSMVRYIAWAIPSIGFIGTVRGIGDALGQAHKAVEGDIAGVTESLGVAFNSTFIALLISIVLMFLLHQLTLQQERLVLDAETYVDQHLIRHLRSAA